MLAKQADRRFDDLAARLVAACIAAGLSMA
jgi:hypothetical protein